MSAKCQQRTHTVQQRRPLNVRYGSEFSTLPTGLDTFPPRLISLGLLFDCKMRMQRAHRDFHRKFEPIDFGFPAFCWHNYPLCLPRSHSCEGYRDGAEKAKSIRWQAQEEIQDRDPKDGSAWGKKRKIPQACANFGRQGLGCLSRGRRHRQRHRPAAQ
jgi:hypothetical protein